MALTLHSAFAEDKSLVSRVGPTYSITRATNGTYRDNTGTIQTAGSGVARFDHDLIGTSLGLLVEEARTQLAIWTEDISNAAWVASNITKGTTTVTAPDGASNSNVRLTASAANGTLLQTVTSASATRAYSVYMKRVTGTGNIDITVDGGATWTTKTLTASWQRFDISQAAVTNPQFGVRIVTSGDAIDFWGSQLENGAFATSYISNNSATASVTRNAEDVTGTLTGQVDQVTGTFYAKAVKENLVNDFAYVMQIDDGSNTDRFLFYQANSINPKFLTVESAGGQEANINGTNFSEGVFTQMAIGATTDDVAYYQDGSLNGADSTYDGLADALTTIRVGRSITAGTEFNGHIAEIRYYNERFDNGTLLLMSQGIFPTFGLSFVRDIVRSLVRDLVTDLVR